MNLESLLAIFLKEKQDLKAASFGKKIRKLKAGTLVSYKLKLQRFLDYLKSKGINRSEELSAKDIADYSKEIQERKQNLKNGAHNALWVVQTFLVWLSKNQAILFEVKESLALPKQVRTKKEPVSLEKVQSQISRLIGKDLERDSLILALFLIEGLSIKQIQSFTMLDLDLEEGQVRLNQKKRFHDLQKKTLEYLKRYLRIRNRYLPKTDYVLVNHKGLALNEAALQAVVRVRRK